MNSKQDRIKIKKNQGKFLYSQVPLLQTSLNTVHRIYHYKIEFDFFFFQLNDNTVILTLKVKKVHRFKKMSKSNYKFHIH